MLRRNEISFSRLTRAALITLLLLATLALAPPSRAGRECAGTWWVNPGDLALGGQLPEFGFATCEGDELTTGALTGQPLLINFWATWCPPCVRELPNLAQVHVDNEGEVTVVGVAVDASPEAVRTFLEHNELPYTLAWDSEGIAADLGFNSIPATVAVAADGTVVDIHRGYASVEDLTALLKAAGGESAETSAEESTTDHSDGIDVGDNED